MMQNEIGRLLQRAGALRRAPAALGRLVVAGAAVLIASAAPAAESDAGAAQFDLLFTNARIIDGTGNPGFIADIAIRERKIAAVGRLRGVAAARIVDATGKTLVPGFIDLHSHAYEESPDDARVRDPRFRAAPNLIAQGITTAVINNDGRSYWPISEQISWLRAGGIGLNVLPLAGHSTIRGLAMQGDQPRAATAAEIDRMRKLMQQAMTEGAAGLSAGLEYNFVTGRYASTDELKALMEEAAPYGGVYVAHQRSHGPYPMPYFPSQETVRPPTLLDGLAETIEIGRATGATVVGTHIQLNHEHYWGMSREAVRIVDEARARGVQIYLDQYPYHFNGDETDTRLIPPWVFPGSDERAGSAKTNYDYTAKLRAVLSDPKRAADLRLDLAHQIPLYGGPENIYVRDHPDRSLIGKSLAQIVAAQGRTPVDAVISLQLEGDRHRWNGGHLQSFSMSESDLDVWAAQTYTATSSDAAIALGTEPAAQMHPRYYGAFPRKIRRYALERGALSLEDAIRASTSLPAQIMGLRDRGQIREGFWADLVVMDLDRLRDWATIRDPHRPSDGIEQVLVNGEFVVEGGSVTGRLPGLVVTSRPDRAHRQ